MSGFPLDPQILSQFAAASFRPPPAPGMPSLNLQPQLMQPYQAPPGFSVGDGIAALSAALAAFKPKGMGGDGTIVNMGPQGSGPGGAYTTADAMAMAGLNNGQTLSPLDPGYGDLGGPGTKAVQVGPLSGLLGRLGLRMPPGGLF